MHFIRRMKYEVQSSDKDNAKGSKLSCCTNTLHLYISAQRDITSGRNNKSCCSSTNSVTRRTAGERERDSGGGKGGFAAAVQIFVIAVT